jgi:hypothetical protein
VCRTDDLTGQMRIAFNNKRNKTRAMMFAAE